MADNINTNPFHSDDDDFIENTIEEPTDIVPEQSESIDLGWDSIAAKLLKDKFVLTALELHTELVEAGRELPRLRDFFSNPGNFERTKEDSPPSTLPRTSSIQTFDSLDFARYSDDGERQVDERVAVLEFELRKAQDTIKSLRASLTKEAEKEHAAPTESTVDGKNCIFSADAITTLEKKAINFLVNNFLLQINNKITAVTFSEENEDQDFETWDDVGLNISQPPDLIHLYRDYYNRVAPSRDVAESCSQTELDGPGLDQVEVELEELSEVKKNLEAKLVEMEEELITKDKEMLRRRGVAEGSESEPLPSPLNEAQSSLFDDIPLPSYSPDIHSDDGDDTEISDLNECTCEAGKEEKCPACLRVNSPEVYRLDFTDNLDQSGDLEGTAHDANNDSKHKDTHKQSTSDAPHSKEAESDISMTDNTGSYIADDNVNNSAMRNSDQADGKAGVESSGNSTANTTNATQSNVTDTNRVHSDSKGKQDIKRERTPVRRVTKETTKEQQTGNKAQAKHGSDGMDKCNRKMSASFSKALKDVCFNVPKDNRIVLEVSKITDADLQKVVAMLGRCLPHIVPNVLLAKREELIPLIICTAMLHPDASERDTLLNILFNLIKKPDEEQRQMILTGCLAFAQHVGPTRLEAELLPQCWEQISHKYMERRLLVAEACGALAGYLPSEIRSSLVLSMLQQMLQDDKEAEVREAVVRSLGLIIGFISNNDKYSQGSDLLKTALKDSSEKVVTSAKQIFLPSFATWAYELGKLEHSLLHGMLRDLEQLTSLASQKSPGGLAPLNEGRFLLYVTSLQELIPFLYISVLESGPYMARLEETLSSVDELHKSRFPAPSSQLTDLTVIVGSKRCLAAMVKLFEEHIDQEWFEPWDSLNWVVNNFIPRLLEVVMGSALSFPRIVSCLARCFYKISTTFGKTFVDKKIKPRFIDVLLMGEEHMDPSNTFTSSSTPLTTCMVPVYASGVLSAFKTEEDMHQLSQFLREALFCLSIYQAPKDSLKIAITELCSSTSNHELLLNVLWEGVVHSSAQVRATAARLFEIPLHSVSEAFASTRVLPALVTLGSDPDIFVRIGTIPALGTLIETVHSKEILEKVYMQLQSFLDDPMYREEHTLHIELISTFARIAPNTEQKFRDEFMLPRLTAMSLENNNQANEGKKREMALQLFEAYSSLSCCFINYQLVQEAMLPGLRCLKQDMAVIAPEHEEVINSMIKEYESKIETSRPADRSSSFTGSFSSLPSGEDVKARMMNRLKESTTKANISNLFTRKK